MKQLSKVNKVLYKTLLAFDYKHFISLKKGHLEKNFPQYHSTKRPAVQQKNSSRPIFYIVKIKRTHKRNLSCLILKCRTPKFLSKLGTSFVR